MGVGKSVIAIRNQRFPIKFDGTLGYPGEGPRRAKDRRSAKSRLRAIPQKRKRTEFVLGRRTSVERRVARMGISLRDGVVSAKTRQLYATAFLRLWALGPLTTSRQH